MAILKTNKFPGELIAAVGDLIPNHSWSASVWRNDDGTGQASANENDIGDVRRAIRLAKEAAYASGMAAERDMANANLAVIRAARTGG